MSEDFISKCILFGSESIGVPKSERNGLSHQGLLARLSLLAKTDGC
jgi:hypothetical protein